MKILGRIALGLVGLLVVVLVIGALLPRKWHVEQSIVIQAPPERIHPFLDDLHKWADWAAWNKDMDPKVVWTYEGPDRGVGARWAWNGPVMGKGRMEIVKSDPTLGLTIDEAIEADEVNAQGRFVYTREGAGTKVTWIDEGTLPPVIGGYFRGTIEEMLAANFAKGLEKLKGLVEALPAPAPPPPPATPADADAGAMAHDAGTP
ncbi:MAG: SRPBCC family protein [Myxococcota bacterium]